VERNDEHTIRSGYLAVGDGHELFYELWGNPNGHDVLFFHGGPGYRYTQADKQLFDPKIHRVTFYDQRGAGQSRYKDPFKSNNTGKLIADVDKLRQHLDIRQASLVGGSWGSTMALLHAMTNTHLVNSIVLRAFFPANKECIEIIADKSNAGIVPDAYMKFINLVPRESRERAIAYYSRHLRSGTPAKQAALATAWQDLAMALGRIEAGTEDPDDHILHAAMTAYYAHNLCFLPDNYLYENAGRFAGMPIHIVHGTRDLLCPVSFARKFAELVPGTVLEEVDAGHSLQDQSMVNALKSSIEAAID